MSDFELITTQVSLDAFCQSAQQHSALFLDTEFVRTRTLKPKLGLIQAYDGDNLVLIDPLADIDLSPLWQLLKDERIVKVLHSCSEDLEVFKCQAGCQPTPLFDTQIAATFLGEGPSMGYAPLVNKLLGVSLDKGEARTNWLARPLTDKQLDYAAKDVLYLKSIYHQLRDKVEQAGVLEFVLNEGELLIAKRTQEKLPDQIYLDIKGAWRLGSLDLAILRNLASWRLREATRRDLALNFVVKEANLITIARNKPQNLQQLKQLPGLLPQEIRFHGNAILHNVQQAQMLPAEQRPSEIVRLVDFPGYKGAYRDVKDIVEQFAEKANVPVEAIASKRQVNQVLSWLWKLDDSGRETAFKPDLLQGWRGQLMAQSLLEKLNVS